MEQVGSGIDALVFLARVSSFDVLNRVLAVADEHKLKELQEIIEGTKITIQSIICSYFINLLKIVFYLVNRDPFNNIFGISSEGGKGLVEAFDIFNKEVDQKKKDHFSKLYKLLLIINSFDLKITQNALKSLQK